MKGKIIGYILLAFSILIIVGVTVNVYFVFTGQAAPVNVFKPLTTSSLLPVPQEAAVLENQNGGNNDLSVGLNIFAHLALMSFVSSAAFKIGRLGVMMIRPIRVRLNQEK
jgi:hypothetical protein